MSAVGAGGAECVWFKHPTRCYALGAVTQRQGDKIVLRDLGAAPAVAGAGMAKPPEGQGGAGWLAPSSGPPGQGGGEGAGETHTVATSTTLACDATHLLDVDDLATMNNLDEAPLLCLLERRLTSASAHRALLARFLPLFAARPYRCCPREKNRRIQRPLCGAINPAASTLLLSLRSGQDLHAVRRHPHLAEPVLAVRDRLRGEVA